MSRRGEFRCTKCDNFMRDYELQCVTCGQRRPDEFSIVDHLAAPRRRHQTAANQPEEVIPLLRMTSGYQRGLFEVRYESDNRHRSRPSHRSRHDSVADDEHVRSHRSHRRSRAHSSRRSRHVRDYSTSESEPETISTETRRRQPRSSRSSIPTHTSRKIRKKEVEASTEESSEDSTQESSEDSEPVRRRRRKSSKATTRHEDETSRRRVSADSEASYHTHKAGRGHRKTTKLPRDRYVSTSNEEFQRDESAESTTSAYKTSPSLRHSDIAMKTSALAHSQATKARSPAIVAGSDPGEPSMPISKCGSRHDLRSEWPQDHYPKWTHDPGRTRIKEWPNCACGICERPHPTRLHTISYRLLEVWQPKCTIMTNKLNTCDKCVGQGGTRPKIGGWHATAEHGLGCWRDHPENPSLSMLANMLGVDRKEVEGYEQFLLPPFHFAPWIPLPLWAYVGWCSRPENYSTVLPGGHERYLAGLWYKPDTLQTAFEKAAVATDKILQTEGGTSRIPVGVDLAASALPVDNHSDPKVAKTRTGVQYERLSPSSSTDLESANQYSGLKEASGQAAAFMSLFKNAGEPGRRLARRETIFKAKDVPTGFNRVARKSFEMKHITCADFENLPHHKDLPSPRMAGDRRDWFPMVFYEKISLILHVSDLVLLRTLHKKHYQCTGQSTCEEDQKKIMQEAWELLKPYIQAWKPTYLCFGNIPTDVSVAIRDRAAEREQRDHIPKLDRDFSGLDDRCTFEAMDISELQLRYELRSSLRETSNFSSDSEDFHPQVWPKNDLAAAVQLQKWKDHLVKLDEAVGPLTLDTWFEAEWRLVRFELDELLRGFPSYVNQKSQYKTILIELGLSLQDAIAQLYQGLNAHLNLVLHQKARDLTLTTFLGMQESLRQLYEDYEKTICDLIASMFDEGAAGLGHMLLAARELDEHHDTIAKIAGKILPAQAQPATCLPRLALPKALMPPNWNIKKLTEEEHEKDDSVAIDVLTSSPRPSEMELW